MPEWSLFEWVSAGDVPLLAVVIVFLWRLERRVLRIEYALELEADK